MSPILAMMYWLWVSCLHFPLDWQLLIVFIFGKGHGEIDDPLTIEELTRAGCDHRKAGDRALSLAWATWLRPCLKDKRTPKDKTKKKCTKHTKTQFPHNFKTSKNLMRVKLESLRQCLHHTRRVNHNQNESADCLNNFKDAFQLCHFRIRFYSNSIWGVLIVWKAQDWILWRRQGQESHPEGRE